jgi:hypothetical protein
MSGAHAAPFGFGTDEARNVIADAGSLKAMPLYVWVPGGSGLLVRSLRQAWPHAEHHVVQVGAALAADDVGSDGTVIHQYPKAYGWRCPHDAPFSGDRHYELKTWNTSLQWRTGLRVKFCFGMHVMSRASSGRGEGWGPNSQSALCLFRDRQT